MPVDMAMLMLYVPVCVAMALLPGSDTLFVLSRSIASGPAAGIATGLGVCMGLNLYAAAVGLGLAGVFAYSPLLYEIVRIGGVVYLVYLAVQAFRAPAALPLRAARQGGGRRLGRFFLQGVLNDLTNPKAVVFFAALFPQFMAPERGNLLAQALILNNVGNAIYIVVLAAVAFAGGRLGRWLARNPRVARIQQWLVGTLFLGLAARLALAARQN